MSYTLGTAAKQAGVAKSTISRAIERGQLSAIREGNGFRIDPSELDRWMNTRATQPPAQDTTHPPVAALLEQQIEHLKELVATERRRADAAESDRDEWRKQAQTLALTGPARATQERRGGFWSWMGGHRASNA